MFGVGVTEMLVILAIVVLLFGSRLPNVGRSLGEGIRNFKKGLAGGDGVSDSNSDTTRSNVSQEPHKLNDARQQTPARSQQNVAQESPQSNDRT